MSLNTELGLESALLSLYQPAPSHTGYVLFEFGFSSWFFFFNVEEWTVFYSFLFVCLFCFHGSPFILLIIGEEKLCNTGLVILTLLIFFFFLHYWDHMVNTDNLGIVNTET